MKKVISALVIAVTLAVSVPVPTHAQSSGSILNLPFVRHRQGDRNRPPSSVGEVLGASTSAEQEAQIAALKAQIAELIKQMIALLQKQMLGLQ